MRTPKDLADHALTSDAEHARRATALRRLAGGIHSQTKGVLGLSDKERKTLTDAHALIEKMADVSKQAAAIAKQRRLDRVGRERAIRMAMKTNFVRLTSVEDQVALIGMVNRDVMTPAVPGAKNLRRLRAEFDEALDGLAGLLARSNDRSPEALVAEAWTRFERTKAATQTKHRVLIEALGG